MKRPANYNTKQREAILTYIQSLGGEHATASQIIEHLKKEGSSISPATVYRHLDKLAESGVVRKYCTDSTSGACYQYAGHEEDCGLFHLKCESCGKVLHLCCERLDEIKRHLCEAHSFQVDETKMVLLGKCVNCGQ